MSHRTLSAYFVFLVALLVAPAILFGAEKLEANSNSDCLSTQDRAVCNVILGSSANKATTNAVGVAIGGGGEPAFPNQVTGNFGAIGGGLGNTAGDLATIAGGSRNAATGFHSTVSGGSNNIASFPYTTVGGGENNIAGLAHATVSGGTYNTASARDTTVSGGSGNLAGFTLATVAGGANNAASSLAAAIGGGDHNVASGAFATVSGGSSNHASGFNATVTGGSGNIAHGNSATVGGGLANWAAADYSTVAGGSENTAGTGNDDPRIAHYAAVGGGSQNTASGAFSTIPGGLSNSAASAYSFAAGRRARIDSAHPGAVLFADSSDSDFNSFAANEFAVRAIGGVRFVTAVDSAGSPSAGVRLAKGSGSWELLSDRNAKENITTVDGRAVVKQLAEIPLTAWNYKTEAASIRHIGPMAQDFRAFGVGAGDQYISIVDANGVAPATIQGLYELKQEQDNQMRVQQQQIATLKSENAALQTRIDDLDSRMAAMEQAVKQNSVSTQPVSALQSIWAFFSGLGLIGLVLSRR